MNPKKKPETDRRQPFGIEMVDGAVNGESAEHPPILVPGQKLLFAIDVIDILNKVAIANRLDFFIRVSAETFNGFDPKKIIAAVKSAGVDISHFADIRLSAVSTSQRRTNMRFNQHLEIDTERDAREWIEGLIPEGLREEPAEILRRELLRIVVAINHNRITRDMLLKGGEEPEVSRKPPGKVEDPIAAIAGTLAGDLPEKKSDSDEGEWIELGDFEIDKNPF